MKKIMMALMLLFITTGLQAQNLYLAADIGANGNLIERADIGVTFGETDQATRFRVLTGYAGQFARGEYMHVGIGVTHNVGMFTASGDLRGVFGQFKSSKLEETNESEGGVAYSLFAGLRYKQFALGPSLEQYVLISDRIFINPVSIRLHL